jgi:hypothetical protein
VFKKCNNCGALVEFKGGREWKKGEELLGWFYECSCRSTLLKLNDAPKETENRRPRPDRQEIP